MAGVDLRPQGRTLRRRMMVLASACLALALTIVAGTAWSWYRVALPALQPGGATHRGAETALAALVVLQTGSFLILGVAAIVILRRVATRALTAVEEAATAAEELIPHPAAADRPEGPRNPIAALRDTVLLMAERVRAAARESETLNRSLTAKVSQRTEELRQKNLALAFQNEKVIEADRMKSAFFASVSHELRTPLNAILALTDMLREEIAGPLNDEQRRHVGMIHSSGENLLNLINEVLDLSRIEAGRMEVRYENIALVDRLLQAVEELRPLAESKGLALTVRAEGAGHVVRADAEKARMVVTNLLGNAIKFTAEGGVSVRVQLLEEEHLLSVEVEDTGPGIAPEHQRRVFLEFQRIDASEAAPQKGTGLGLAICKRLVNLMGGDIWVDSAPGRGSRFAFVVPTQPVTSRPVEPPVPMAPLPDGPARVLVVGAQAAAAGALARHLRQSGTDALIARDGAGAERLLRAERIDLLLVLMQSGGGSEAAWIQAFGNDALLARVPVVAHSREELSAEARRRFAEHPAAVLLEGDRCTRDLVDDALLILHSLRESQPGAPQGLADRHGQAA